MQHTEKKMSTEQLRKMLGKAFYINGDEKALLKKVSAGDKVALVQLTMLHMPYIISCAQRDRYEGLSLTALVDAATQGFIAAAEKAASENSDLHDHTWKMMHSAISDALAHVPETGYKRINYHTPKRIAYLNSLNTLLKEKERQIVERAKIYLDEIRQKMESNDSFTNDYELEVIVQYYMKGGQDPAHEYTTHYRYEHGEDWGMLCSEEDGRDSYMPVLDEPYCYLLHDLIDHSRIGEGLFRIGTIWIDVRLWDQHFVKLKTN